jgi:hypothetical protein
LIVLLDCVESDARLFLPAVFGAEAVATAIESFMNVLLLDDPLDIGEPESLAGRSSSKSDGAS